MPQVEQYFGTVKRSALPFVYIGINHVRTPVGSLFLHQSPYLSKLKSVQLDDGRSRQDNASCDDLEHFNYRSLLCSMLWLCLTRQDIVHETVLLQTSMQAPLIKHVKQLNTMLSRTWRNRALNGIHFHRLQFPLRLAGVSDAGHATSSSAYAFEGKIVLLLQDPAILKTQMEWFEGSDAQKLGGVVPQLTSKS